MSQAVEFVEEVCGIYFRSVLLNQWELIAQHAHDHDHASYVGSGAVRLFKNGIDAGIFRAGHAVPIRAGVQHAFQALEANTRIACVHDVRSAESVKAKEK